MIPHEHAPLTRHELAVLAELERDVADVPIPMGMSEQSSSWPHQLAGVVVVAVSALLVAGLANAGRSSSLIVAEAMIGVMGLLAGAIIAIDPARRYVRCVPSGGLQQWARMRRRLADRRHLRRRLKARRPRLIGR